MSSDVAYVVKARVTKPAPAFTCPALLPGGEFGEVSLEKYTAAGKWVLLFFYPLDFTFVCPTEICAFSDRVAEFKALNCEVVSASVDSLFSHLAWTQQARKMGGLGPMEIPIISDLKHNLSKDYGVYMEDAGHSLRGLFIIDDKGILKHALHNSPEAGRSVDEALRLVQAYQYAAVHGEVCPAGWKPGSATIKPTPKQKGEYFEKQ